MCFIKLILGNECIVPGFLDERAMGARTHDWKSIDLSFRLFFLGGKIVTGVIDLPMKFWGNGDWEWEFMGNGKHSTIPWPFHSVGPTLRSYPRTIFCLLTTCEQAHYVSPPRAGCFFHGRQVRPGKSEAMRPIPWYQDWAGYAPLTSRFRCWWAR